MFLSVLINSPAVKSQDGVLVESANNDRGFGSRHQEVMVRVERYVEVDEKADIIIPIGRRASGSSDVSAPSQSVVADKHIV